MKAVGTVLLALCLAAPAGARGPFFPDGMAVEIGQAAGIADTGLLRGDLLWAWPGELLRSSGSSLSAQLELSVGVWKGDRTIADFGFTPLFRWESRRPGFLGEPYLEAGAGVHLISDVQMYERCFSTALQFGEHIGVGTRLGAGTGLDLSYRLEHLSNGGIKEPNSGMLFNIVRLALTF